MPSPPRHTVQLVARAGRICARAQDPLQLLELVAGLVRAAVPYDAAGWLLVDPETLLPNAVHAEGVSRDQHLALIECEVAEDDVTKFVDLARSEVPAAALSAATGGDLARSTRWRRVYRPAGLGDELRAVFRSGSAVWGNACLARRADAPSFNRADVDLVRRVCPHVGNGIRASLLLAGLREPRQAGEGAAASGALDGSGPPALVVLTDDGRVESATPQARWWLGDLEDEQLVSTIVLHEVAHRARLLAEDGATVPPARAWARARTGEPVIVRGARLEDQDRRTGRTALVIEPARRPDIAPLLLHLHGLTDREREVTQLLLQGMPTTEIAARLWISAETLRGHVKSVFAKLGVNSRAELAAELTQPRRSHARAAAPSAPRTR